MTTMVAQRGDLEWVDPPGTKWQLTACVKRCVDGWMWHVRFNKTLWAGGPLPTRNDAMTSIRKRMDEIILRQDARRKMNLDKGNTAG